MFSFKGMTDKEMLRWRERMMTKIHEGKREEVADEIEEYKTYLKAFPWN